MERGYYYYSGVKELAEKEKKKKREIVWAQDSTISSRSEKWRFVITYTQSGKWVCKGYELDLVLASFKIMS